MNRILVGLALVLFAASCGDDAAPSVNTTTKSYTKAEAAAANGLTADGQDICEIMAWYTDGVCDDFCKVMDDECNEIIVPAECGGDDVVCANGEYCSFAISAECGSLAGGKCEVMPSACTADENPVCGCDGTTYSNPCAAASAGVSVEATGPCAVPCDTSADCEGQICVEGVCVEGCTTNADCGEDFCTEGVCGPAVTVCNETTACSVGDFCYLGTQDACGASDGMCQTIPDVCTREVEPVCGCDDVTYINACAAATAGANIATLGECPRACTATSQCLQGELCQNSICVPSLGVCGGRTGATCEADSFCNIPSGCGFADETGICTETPLVCPKNLAPVCGCDGTTYTNSCGAALAGVSIEYTGACKTACTKDIECNRGETCQNGYCDLGISPITCGGRNGGVCSITQWCNYGGPINACGAFDAPGTCEVRPALCAIVNNPVCGCDGNTYGNDCQAHAAGVDIVSVGNCPATM